jgi:isopenicillin N synthase-like dioxygenase
MDIMDPDSLQNNSTVKVVDFAPFLDGSDRQGVSNAILDSFKTTGFVYLMNHGLPQNMIDSMFFWVCPNDRIPKFCPN